MVAARAVYERVLAEHAAVEGGLPGLAEAVRQAREMVRERSIRSKLMPSEEAICGVTEARALLSATVEAETSSIRESEALAEAKRRAAEMLEAEVRKAADEDARILRSVLLREEAVEQLRRDALDVVDRLFAMNYVKGRHGTIQALLGDFLGLGLGGAALSVRYEQRRRRILDEAKSKKEVAP